jgi:hypothetical protein
MILKSNGYINQIMTLLSKVPKIILKSFFIKLESNKGKQLAD